MNENELLRTPVFNVVERFFKGQQFCLLKNRDWVNVFAFSGPNLWLVEQKRFGGEYLTVEPAGGLVENEQSNKDAAKEELQEELGLVAAEMVHAGSFMPNPGLMNNNCHCYIAIDCEPIVNHSPEEGVKPVSLSSSELKSWLFDTPPVHGLVIASALLVARKASLLRRHHPDWSEAFRALVD
ncbi:NUDIX hydrolase [Ponticaulis profundi]